MGYWGKPELTAARFQATISGESPDKHWYRTGDLGFIYNNEIFISGRIKDMIIENGRNIYPQDIEEMVPQDRDLFLEWTEDLGQIGFMSKQALKS